MEFLDKPDISREDLQMLSKSMKDPKFHEILGEYMLEVSDPNNRAEHDQYLRQLQKDGELPKGMNLIEPRAFFCMQSKLASEADKKFTQKLYINVCTHEDVDAAGPSSQGKGGQNWRVPYLVGKNRYDQDTNSGDQPEIVSVIDIVFNHNIRDFSRVSSDFKKMVCDIAIDAINKASAVKKERVDMDYRVVNDFACKGEKPALLPVRAKDATEGVNLADKNEKPKLYHEIMDIKEKEQQKNANEKKKGLEKDEELEESPIAGSESGSTPKYKLFYSYATDSSDFIETKAKETKRPTAIKIAIELPKVDKLANIRCDIRHQDLVLEYPDTYYLLLRIPVAVDEENYKAKFDRSKKVLNLEFVPLKQSAQSNQHSEIANKDPNENSATIAASDHEADNGLSGSPQKHKEIDQPQEPGHHAVSSKKAFELVSCNTSYMYVIDGKLVDSKVLDRSMEPAALVIKAVLNQPVDLANVSIIFRKSLIDFQVNDSLLLSLTILIDLTSRALFVVKGEVEECSVAMYLSFTESADHQIELPSEGPLILEHYKSTQDNIDQHMLGSKARACNDEEIKPEIQSTPEEKNGTEPQVSNSSEEIKPRSMAIFNAQTIGNKCIIQLRSDYKHDSDFQAFANGPAYLLFNELSSEYFSFTVKNTVTESAKIDFQTKFYGGFVVISFTSSTSEPAYQTVEYLNWPDVLEARDRLKPNDTQEEPKKVSANDETDSRKDQMNAESPANENGSNNQPPNIQPESIRQFEGQELSQHTEKKTQEEKRPGFGFLNLEITKEALELV